MCCCLFRWPQGNYSNCNFIDLHMVSLSSFSIVIVRFAVACRNMIMSTARFRRIFGLDSDQHVSHIIARANGGADHRDNYMTLSGAMNQLLGKHGDHIMCFLAGQNQCRRAIEASAINIDHDELYRAGKELMKKIMKKMI